MEGARLEERGGGVTRIDDLLESLATCLCAQITADGSPETCFCGVIPGDQPVAGYSGDCSDKCGMAWVRSMAIYPAVTLGALNETADNCGSMLGIDIQMGVLRCVKVGDEFGNMPNAAELLSDARQQHTDAMSIWKAIACCGDLTSKDYTLGPWVPMGPMGGYSGGAFTLSVML